MLLRIRFECSHFCRYTMCRSRVWHETLKWDGTALNQVSAFFFTKYYKPQTILNPYTNCVCKYRIYFSMLTDWMVSFVDCVEKCFIWNSAYNVVYCMLFPVVLQFSSATISLWCANQTNEFPLLRSLIQNSTIKCWRVCKYISQSTVRKWKRKRLAFKLHHLECFLSEQETQNCLNKYIIYECQLRFRRYMHTHTVDILLQAR